jgi:hypothetical protein
MYNSLIGLLLVEKNNFVFKTNYRRKKNFSQKY